MSAADVLVMIPLDTSEFDWFTDGTVTRGAIRYDINGERDNRRSRYWVNGRRATRAEYDAARREACASKT